MLFMIGDTVRDFGFSIHLANISQIYPIYNFIPNISHIYIYISQYIPIYPNKWTVGSYPNNPFPYSCPITSQTKPWLCTGSIHLRGCFLGVCAGSMYIYIYICDFSASATCQPSVCPLQRTFCGWSAYRWGKEPQCSPRWGRATIVIGSGAPPGAPARWPTKDRWNGSAEMWMILERNSENGRHGLRRSS